MIRINGSGTSAVLRSRLLKMRDVDQSIRKKLFALPPAEQQELGRKLENTDRQLTNELKKIVADNGWPTISLVGFEACQAAMLILIHSPDHDFQRRLLPTLDNLVQQRKLVGEDIATLTDKLLVADGKPQRSGTQFSWHGNSPMAMDPVEDPSHLDERRELYSLPPMHLYKRGLAAMYHREVNYVEPGSQARTGQLTHGRWVRQQVETSTVVGFCKLDLVPKIIKYAKISSTPGLPGDALFDLCSCRLELAV